MMIDVRGETLLHFREAAEKFPGGKRHISTVHRYRLRGIGGVRLEALKLGGRWYTSEQAIDRFVAQLTAKSSDAMVCLRATAGSIGLANAEKNLDSAWGPTT